MDTPADKTSSTPRAAAPATGDSSCPRQWYVAYVNIKCEKSTAQKLDALGYETFVPSQTEIHQWSDRKKKVERILIPMMVFFRADSGKAKEVERLSYIRGLLRAPGDKNAAIIPDDQIERFKFMIGHSETPVTMAPLTLSVGDKVKVSRGKLAGLTGHVARPSGSKSKIVIRIEFLGYACLELPITDLQPLK